MNVTVQEAGRALGIAKGAADRLAACGLLGEVSMRGNRRTVSATAVLGLQNRPDLETTTPPALVVRVGAPTSVEEKWRSWIGWLDSWPHKVQQDAVRGDWVIDPNAVLKAGRLVVLVAGFVVAAYAVTGIESQYLDEAANRRRARFIVKDDEVIAAPFVNRRWRLSRGWTVSLINGQPTKELVTITEAARMLGLSRPTLMKHIESGEISHVNVGTHHRVPAEAVLEFQRTRKARRGKAAEALAEFSNEIGFVE